MAGIAGKPFFVFHEGYDYFESAYGLKHTGTFSVASEVQPGAQHVAAMRKRLQEVGKTCVFSDPPLRPRLADTLTAGLPVKLAELDALGGYTPATARGVRSALAWARPWLVGKVAATMPSMILICKFNRYKCDSVDFTWHLRFYTPDNRFCVDARLTRRFSGA